MAHGLHRQGSTAQTPAFRLACSQPRSDAGFVLVEYPVPGEVFKIYLDIAKARQGLGWEPRFSLEEGLKATLEWFRGATWN